jgi:hypothetical protein
MVGGWKPGCIVRRQTKSGHRRPAHVARRCSLGKRRRHASGIRDRATCDPEVGRRKPTYRESSGQTSRYAVPDPALGNPEVTKTGRDVARSAAGADRNSRAAILLFELLQVEAVAASRPSPPASTSKRRDSTARDSGSATSGASPATLTAARPHLHNRVIKSRFRGGPDRLAASAQWTGIQPRVPMYTSRQTNPC